MRTRRLRRERIKLIAALRALPLLAHRRRRPALRTQVSFAPRQLGQPRQRPRMLQPSPATHQDERCQHAQPHRSDHQRQQKQSRYAHKSHARRRHQAARPAQRIPQQRPQDLPAIQRINGQQIKDQQSQIHEPDGPQQPVEVGHGRRPSPAEISVHPPDRGQRRQQRHIHQRPGSNAPQRGPGTRRRIHIRHSAQRPQHDLVSASAHLPASQRVSILMQQHDQEQRQILQHVPGKRPILSRPALDLHHRHQKPRPVQEDIHSRKAKQTDGPSGRHARDYSTRLPHTSRLCLCGESKKPKPLKRV